MKALKKVLLGVMSLACLTAGVTACGFAGGSTANSQNGVEQTEMAQIYAQYVVYAQAEGVEPLSYEAWLATIKGEKGDKGDQGEQGIQGEKGDKGEQGEQGIQGEKGEDGKSAYQIWLDNGYEGTEADFLEWLNGTAGVMGPQGEKGDKGDQGEKGDKGDQGEQGIQGEKGDKGDQGEQGEKGEQGEQGIQGEKGEDGRGIADMQIVDGYLVVTYTDGSTQVLALPTMPEAPDTSEDPEEEEHIHTFGGWMEYHEPDTDNRGYIRVCSGCGEVEWREDDCLQHDWKVVTMDATCQKAGYDTKTCTVCGRVERDNYTEKLEHSWSTRYTYDGNYHWYACTACNEPKEKVEHTADAEECSVCGCPMTSTAGVMYNIPADGTYAEVIGYEGTASKVKIASTYNGLPVTAIYDNAFRGKSITSVIIPDSVTSIGYGAFYNCSSLTSVVIPDSVTSIGSSAFSNCSSLTSVVIPDGVTSIGDYAFSNCSSLTSVDIPDSVTSIGNSAFYKCSSLTSVVIPDSVTSIGNGAFSGCTNLRFSEYGNCKYLGNENNPYHALIQASNQNYSNYTIHEDTKVIADYAFSSCSRMASIVIPDSVTSIGNYAFYKCSSLTSVVIPDSVTSIGEYAFSWCESLTSVVIPDSVTSIGSNAFWGCSSLTSVVIPDSVTSIADDAFYGCDSLTSVVIGDSVTSIGEYAFNGCSLTSVYYKGTASEWSGISIDSGNSKLTNATRYYYSESQPTTTGRYWHYDENGEIAVW